MLRFAWERIGAGARLGSPPVTTGVEDEVWPAAAEESALESGLVGFLRYADYVNLRNFGRIGMSDGNVPSIFLPLVRASSRHRHTES